MIPKSKEEKNVYSTNEQVVGKWIDGKTLYRKVVEINTQGLAADFNMPFSSSNIQNLISIDSICSYYENDVQVFENSQSSSNSTTWFMKVKVYKSNRLRILIGNDLCNKLKENTLNSFFIIIEYTKTTD